MRTTPDSRSESCMRCAKSVLRAAPVWRALSGVLGLPASTRAADGRLVDGGLSMREVKWLRGVVVDVIVQCERDERGRFVFVSELHDEHGRQRLGHWDEGGDPP